MPKQFGARPSTSKDVFHTSSPDSCRLFLRELVRSLQNWQPICEAEPNDTDDAECDGSTCTLAK